MTQRGGKILGPDGELVLQVSREYFPRRPFKATQVVEKLADTRANDLTVAQVQAFLDDLCHLKKLTYKGRGWFECLETGGWRKPT